MTNTFLGLEEIEAEDSCLSQTEEPIEDRRICCDCIGEAFLRAEVKKRGQDGRCSYCDEDEKTFSIAEMADEVERAFDEHYYRTSSEPSYMEYLMSKDEDIGYDWERAGEQVGGLIAWEVEIDEEPAEDIRRVLAERHYDRELEQMGEENPFDEDAYYAGREVDDAESQAGWLHFEESLIAEARYFNPAAEAELTSTFENIGGHQTHDGHPVIVDAGPGAKITAVYRARVFQSEEKLVEAVKAPDREIGPPPSSSASSGRMNPHGVAVFYGATDPLVALAEVRPPVGSRVVIGRFEIVRPIKLLDIEALSSVTVEGSIFDRAYVHQRTKAKFLHWLSKRISQPVMPDDEPFEYLPTQAIADFLATRHDLRLDGILYPSVQGAPDSLNVVMFQKASRVEPLEIPKDTEISVSVSDDTDEGPHIAYWVSEEVPPAQTSDIPLEVQPPDINFPFMANFADVTDEVPYDIREVTLRLDTSTLEVHHVRGVTFYTEKHTVTRHRSEKRKNGV